MAKPLGIPCPTAPRQEMKMLPFVKFYMQDLELEKKRMYPSYQKGISNISRIYKGVNLKLPGPLLLLLLLRLPVRLIVTGTGTISKL